MIYSIDSRVAFVSSCMMSASNSSLKFNFWNGFSEKLREVIHNWQKKKRKGMKTTTTTKKENKTKQSRVRVSRRGCEWSPIQRRYPTTVWRRSFCLLCFHTGPVRSSLTNLENSESSVLTILTPNLARTPDPHSMITHKLGNSPSSHSSTLASK